MALNQFPSEVILDILEYLDIFTTIRFSRTCKRFYDLAQTPDVQYKIALEVCGAQHRKECELTLEKRLELLHNYERSWRTLDYKRMDIVCQPAIAGGDPQFYLSGGLLVIWRSQDDLTRVDAHRLPSSIDGAEHQNWAWTLPAHIDRISVDIEKELIILVSNTSDTVSRCYPRTITDGAVHGLATRPHFDLLLKHRLEIQVCGRHLIAWSIAHTVYVYDWTSPMMITELFYLQPITFIDEDKLLCIDTTDWSMFRSFSVIQLSRPGFPKAILTMALPEELIEGIPNEIRHEDSIPSIHLTNRCWKSSPFSYRQEQELFFISALCVQDREQMTLQFNLGSITSFLPAEGIPEINGTLIVAWEDWSLRGASLMKFSAWLGLEYRSPTRLTSRSRILRCENDRSLSVMDHHPLRIARTKCLRDHLLFLRDVYVSFTNENTNYFSPKPSLGPRPAYFSVTRPSPKDIFKSLDHRVQWADDCVVWIPVPNDQIAPGDYWSSSRHQLIHVLWF